MTAIAASAGQVVFIPKDTGSYFYESFDCQQAVTNGYGGIQFTVQGPAGGSLGFELQTTDSCSNSSETIKRSYNFVSDLTGQRQTVTLPFEGFDGDTPNYDAIVGMAWATFSQYGVQWSIGNITLLCGSVSPPQTTSTTPHAACGHSKRLTWSSRAHEVDDSADGDQVYQPPAGHHIAAADLLEPADR